MHHPSQISAAVLLAASSLTAGADAADAPDAMSMPAQIERIEPAFWWVGMNSDKLQLLVHGPRIADAAPQIGDAFAGSVRIESVSRVANPNYLFIDLRIAPDAVPGRVDIVFSHGDERFDAPFELRARAPSSAQRRGFDSSDVILNLVPDRFANGNPANDNVPGYGDEARRGDDEAGRHRHLQDRSALRQQRGLPPHGGRRARQGHRRDPRRRAEPHRLRALVDAR